MTIKNTASFVSIIQKKFASSFVIHATSASVLNASPVIAGTILSNWKKV
jgi:hypothetical protein